MQGTRRTELRVERIVPNRHEIEKLDYRNRFFEYSNIPPPRDRVPSIGNFVGFCRLILARQSFLFRLKVALAISSRKEVPTPSSAEVPYS